MLVILYIKINIVTITYLSLKYLRGNARQSNANLLQSDELPNGELVVYLNGGNNCIETNPVRKCKQLCCFKIGSSDFRNLIRCVSKLPLKQ